MPNKFNGTFDVFLDGKDYTLRPTFEAMAELRTLTGRSERQLSASFADGTYSLVDVTHVIYAGILGEHRATGEGRRPSLKIIGELVMREGSDKFVGVAMQFVMFGVLPYKEAVAVLDRMNNPESDKADDVEEEVEDEKKTQAG
jgi:hypothetical protein